MNPKKRLMKENELAVSVVIGVILLIAIAITLAAVTLTYSTGILTDEEETPIIIFRQDDTDDSLTVLNADPNLNWDQIEISGIATKPPGPIDAGDKITLCSGTIQIIWTPTNTLLSKWTFT